MAENIRKQFLKGFGARLLKLYSESNFRSYAHFADKLRETGFEVTNDTVSKWMSKEPSEPRASAIVALSKVLNVSADYLLTGKEPESKDENLAKLLKYLNDIKNQANDLSDPRLQQYARRFAALPDNLREAAEQLLRAMEEVAKKKLEE
ncbi:MAG TPA: hypothetical protein ENO07_04945 [candidate division Zixibacteria bacterium]|nr:hypothetical protein [candidate division Zixibacteria bacterium]